MSAYSHPRIGVGVIVVRDGKVLLGQRLGSQGAGELLFPGGHLDKWETLEACARREVKARARLIPITEADYYTFHEPK